MTVNAAAAGMTMTVNAAAADDWHAGVEWYKWDWRRM